MTTNEPGWKNRLHAQLPETEDSVMYVPRYFKQVEQPLLDAFLRHAEFAIIVSVEDDLPLATHIPIEIIRDGDDTFVHGHFARGSRQSLPSTPIRMSW